ncbi:MAG: urease accessory protein UreE, partial [Cyanobacteria bacterium J06576_12]
MNSLDAIVADQYLGNTHESKEIALQISQAQAQQLCLEVAIARQDCGKGRIFTQTEAQQPIGIVKERTWRLRDGDVFRAQ